MLKLKGEVPRLWLSYGKAKGQREATVHDDSWHLSLVCEMEGVLLRTLATQQLPAILRGYLL